MKLHKINKFIILCIMVHIEVDNQPLRVRVSELADWALSHGMSSFTKEDVSQICGVPRNHVSQLLTTLRNNGKVFSPSRGLWVPIPPEYRTWGAPDPALYIDDMMAHLNVEYLVGWLNAAARHGAAHHAVQVFQVAANRLVRNREFGRSRLEFFARNYVGAIEPSKELKRSTGMNIAPPGTTMLMLAADPQICGGMGNVATVIVELAEENQDFSRSLVRDAEYFPSSALQRVGWLLDRFGEGAPEELEFLRPSAMSQISLLVPSGSRTGELDSKWKIVVNEEVEPDL